MALAGCDRNTGAHTLVVVASVVLDRSDLDLALLLSGGDALSNATGVHALFGVAPFSAESDFVKILLYVRNLLGEGKLTIFGSLGHLLVDVLEGDGTAGATLLEALFDGWGGCEFAAGQVDFESTG